MKSRSLWSAVVLVLAFACLSSTAQATEPVSLTPEQATIVDITRSQALAAWLTPADRDLAARAAELYRQGKVDEARALWQKFMEANGKAHSPDELHAVVRWALRTGLLARQPQLLQRSTRVMQAQDLGADIRSYLTLLKATKASFPPLPVTSVPVVIKVVSDGRLVEQGTKPVTRERLNQLIANMVSELEAATVTANRSLYEMQQTAEALSQATSLITSISKAMHEMAKSIISNIRA